jgi:DNA-binding beta-propeller fold protein YncE
MTAKENKTKNTAAYAHSPFGRTACVTMAVFFVFFSLVGSASAALPSALGASAFAGFTGSSAVAPLVKPALASLPSEFGSTGSGAGQFNEPKAIAVDQVTGEVFMVDSDNNRVDEFSGVGKFERAWGWGVIPEEGKPPKEELQVCTEATGCQGGSGGSGEGEFEGPRFLGGIAVDNSGGASQGDVYVLVGGGRLDRFGPDGHLLKQWSVPSGRAVAVSPVSGDVYIGESGQVSVYTSEGTLSKTLTLEEAGSITGLAVNAAGEIYAVEGFSCEGSCVREARPVRYYGAGGVLKETFDREPLGQARSVTLDPSTGEVYVMQELATQGVFQVRGFAPAGAPVSYFATHSYSLESGLAFDGVTGALYVAFYHAATVTQDVEVIVPPEPGPTVSKESTSAVEPTAAVVHATIDPETEVPGDETAYRVEYGICTSTSSCEVSTYEHSAPSPEGLLAPSFNEEEVKVPLSGLSPQSKYHYRVVATNKCEEVPGSAIIVTCERFGENGTFTTQPPALVEEEFSTEVRSTSATLHALVNPLGSTSTLQFVYGPCGQGECATPDQPIGSGKTGVSVEAHIQGLVSGREYHYRVLVTNALEQAPGEVQGEQDTFTTQTGGEAGLPDGREWVLVSPPDKHGATVKGTEAFTFVQAAADGDAVVYSATDPTESQPRGHGESVTQVFSSRAGAGTSSPWESYDLQTPHTEPVGAEPISHYNLFSSDLSLGVHTTAGGFEPALSSEATENTPYLFHAGTRTYTPLVTHPGDDTTEPFVPFGGEPEGLCTDEPGPGLNCPPTPEGANPDLSDIILGNGVVRDVPPLLKGANEAELYEWSAGKLSLVSVLPSGDPAGESLLGAGVQRYEVVGHAVSEDGSRVFWQAVKSAGGNLSVTSFMRDMTHGHTILGDGETLVGETIELPGGFEGANANGTLVFAGGKECEIPLSVPLELRCEPVLGENHQPLPELVLMATSEDGAIAYYKSEHSIYVLHHGSSEAKLVASNIGQITAPEYESGIYPPYDPWRASPDGEWFAFMSDSPLTGYDNRDAVSGAPDEEVYLYNAAADRLVCASCDPTGERPHGTAAVHLPLADYADVAGDGQSVAATIPGWAPYLTGRAVYDPRIVSDSGRLFFNATDGLVPKDVNGQVDVYELEQPAGAAGGSESADNCTTATRTGSDVYVPAAAGCVALISNGESDEESAFEDASESGEDVFFLSSSHLSTADLDGSLSMWDAQVCTAGHPCPPAPATAPTPCNTEASCKASPAPQPTIYQAPASATFNGPGNVAAEPPAKPASASTPACSSSAGTPSAKCTKKQNLTKALATCKRKYPHNNKKRSGCEASSRKRYAAKASARKSTRKSSR